MSKFDVACQKVNMRLVKYHSLFVSCSGIATNVIITKLMLAGRQRLCNQS